MVNWRRGVLGGAVLVGALCLGGAWYWGEQVARFEAELEAARQEADLDVARARVEVARAMLPGRDAECDRVLEEIEQTVAFRKALAQAEATTDFQERQFLIDQALELAVTDAHRQRCAELQQDVERLGLYEARIAAAEVVADTNPAYARRVYAEALELALTPAHVAYCTERREQLAEEIVRRDSFRRHLTTARGAFKKLDIASTRAELTAARKLATLDAEHREHDELLANVDERDHFETELARARKLIENDPHAALEVLGELVSEEPTPADAQRVDKLMTRARQRIADRETTPPRD